MTAQSERDKERWRPTLDLDGPLKIFDETASETADLIIDLNIKLEHPGAHTLIRGIVMGTIMKAMERLSQRSPRTEAAMPRVRAGKCRGCGCTDMRACGVGCEWVDREHTRCSACFEWDKKKKAFVKVVLGMDDF